VVGIYRFWRDMGYVFGGLIAGGAADALGYSGAIALVAGLTAASSLWVLRDMPTGRSRPGTAGAGSSRSDRPEVLLRQPASSDAIRPSDTTPPARSLNLFRPGQ
jgi:hypothetical protein